MFTLDNTENFTQADCNLLNQAATLLVARDGVTEQSADDIVNNNWGSSGNTLDTLTRR